MRTSWSICAANIFQLLARLFELRVGLEFFAVHFAALKNGDAQRGTDVKDAVRGESGVGAGDAVIPAERNGRVVFRRARLFSCIPRHAAWR